MGKQLKIVAWRWGAELMIQLAKSRHRICHALSYPWFRESDEAKTSTRWLLYSEYKRILSITLLSTLLGRGMGSPKVLTQWKLNTVSKAKKQYGTDVVAKPKDFQA
jgi:hypothetical protein